MQINNQQLLSKIEIFRSCQTASSMNTGISNYLIRKGQRNNAKKHILDEKY